jgi:hypothetical protein
MASGAFWAFLKRGIVVLHCGKLENILYIEVGLFGGYWFRGFCGNPGVRGRRPLGAPGIVVESPQESAWALSEDLERKARFFGVREFAAQIPLPQKRRYERGMRPDD